MRAPWHGTLGGLPMVLASSLPRLDRAFCTFSTGLSFITAHLHTDFSTHTHRIYNSRTWTCSRWETRSSAVAAGCWSPCGRFFLWATASETCIRYIQFADEYEPPVGVACDLAPELVEDSRGLPTM